MRQRDDYAHLQAIVENALDVIIRINEKGIIEWVNSASKRIFGYTQNELVGKNISVLVPDPDGIKHDSYISRYIKTKDKRVIGKGKDVLCRKKDGTTFPVHLSIIEIKIDSVRYFTGILRDITGLKQNEIELAQYREHLEEMVESRTKDLKRSNNNLLKKVAERSKIEEGLREREERFRTLSETAFEAIVIAEKGKIVETSPKFAKMFGYKQSEMIGMTALELTAPEYQELVMTNIKNDIEKPYEAVAVRKDQSTFHFEAQGVKISYNGEKVRLTAIRDISQRKAAEMDMHKSNNLLQALNRIQADYIKESDKKAIFDKQLEYLLSMTQSEYGFICEVLHDSDGAPYLKSFAITNVAWNRETKKFYKKNAPKGLEFRNLDTLYGAVVKSGEPVISNDPSNDPRGRGKPKGHPPLNSFLGIPLYSEGEMVGMLGIANRPGGYDEKLVDFLEPFFRTSGNIIQALRMERDLTKAGENIHLLQSITQAVSESQGFHSALEITLKKVCNSIGWDFGESWILNSDSTLLEYGPVWYSSNSEKLKDFKRVSQKFTFSLNSGLPGKVWSSKKPVWIKNTSIESEKIFHRAKYVQDAGLKAGFGVPLIAADQVIAVLVFFNFQSFKEDKRKVEIVSAVAAQLGSVVQRKQAEEKLKESEERYRSLFENAADGIYILRGNQFAYVNPLMERIFGYTSEEMTADQFNMMKLVAPESWDFIKQRSKAWSHGLDIQSKYEFKGITRSGEILDLQVSTVPMEFLGESVVQGILRDITTQNQERAKRFELQQKLDRAERMESLGLLAGGVAHDLNNIIGPIVAYPDLILSDLPEDTPVKNDLIAIKSAAERAADVIADLLALARRGKYEMQTLNLNDVIENYMNSPEFNDAQTRSLYVVTEHELSNSPLNIKGSKTHLHKVIMNMVNNAFDSMENGGVLTIKTRNEYTEGKSLAYDKIHEGEYVVLEVEDLGIGINENDIGAIFDPFFTTKRQVSRRGSGLGLSVVYGIVKDHKGFIDVKSQLGVGTKISIYFPVTTERREAKSITSGDYSGSETLLIVDDDKDQIRLARKLLSSIGYKVDSAENGRKAVEYLKKNKVDLVLLDMIMEDDFSGLDTYKEIIKINPGQKAIIVTGFSKTEQVKEVIKLGAGRYIKKPYDVNEIGRAVREGLDKGKRIL